ncbi:SAM-dependent methyltransferase, partial [Candidatus Beckwithbacteria bacterium]|nr:SAM-dependent methyltransferase [Candidatus Beckwithbacteria bacterium]
MKQNKSSQTALAIALVRACSYLEPISQLKTSDYLASKFIFKSFAFLIKLGFVRNFIHKNLPKGLYEWLILRTKFIDSIVSEAADSQIEQILIFGTGFDTRSIRFSHVLKDSKVFEIDLAQTQNSKKKILTKSKIALPSNLHFISLDLNQASIENGLFKSGIKKQKKTLCILEGVLMYLEPKKVETLLQFLASFASGSQVVFDYVYQSELLGNSSKEKEIVKNLHEDWLWGIDKHAV